MPNPNNVAVVAEQFHGSLQQITPELIGAARFLSEKLGTGVSCFLLNFSLSLRKHKLSYVSENFRFPDVIKLFGKVYPKHGF